MDGGKRGQHNGSRATPCGKRPQCLPRRHHGQRLRAAAAPQRWPFARRRGKNRWEWRLLEAAHSEVLLQTQIHTTTWTELRRADTNAAAVAQFVRAIEHIQHGQSGFEFAKALGRKVMRDV